jgi:hypothetical protein
VSLPLFRVVCVPAALDGEPAGWAADMLRDGDVALLADDTGLDGIDRVAHSLGTEAVLVVRREQSAEQQEQLVMAYAAALPLVWLAGDFSDRVRAWARDRAPMTLLVEAEGGLSDDDRGRVERFVALLGRQSE